MIVPSIDFTDAAIAFGGLVAFHILVLLFTAWSVDFKCFVQFSKVNSIDQADACKVTPAKFSGSKDVVPLHFRSQLTGSASSEDMEEIFFDFRKQRFMYSKDLGAFSKLPYPTKETFGHYLKCTGHGTEAKVATATEKWGRNVFDYPQPTFQKLMKENCMEPFFVFQVFCVGLWCLDEFWYYSVFTLFMLFTFESTMAKARLKTLTDLRRVRVDSQTLMVYRCGKWAKLLGTDLLPGDVVSIGRPSTQTGGEDKTVPADMLLLVGSAIVNEAILTGESTPQWKVPIAGERSDNKLSIKKGKNHVLFGGTKILQHSPDKSFPLKTPDGGCLAVVLRTGFETSQGKLMRTILFSTERVTANSWESGLFILFLVVFAVIAAGYVLVKGLEDPTRSKYKLLLGCSLIITSVIPPELPMELSIAVNTSLLALSRRGIFCTEPFRIPFAGKVDLCCFDKTGTLTSDDMEFRGVGGLTDSVEAETDMSKVPVRTLEILASCHALVFVDNKLVGDPLEKAALKGIDWSYKSDEKALPRKIRTTIRMRTALKIVGAPETIQDRLVDVPASYIETYKRYTRQGSRVLALAFKRLPDMTVVTLALPHDPVGFLKKLDASNIVLFWIMLAPRTCFQVLPYVCYNDNQASEAREMDRDAVESDLTFAGFAVFNCPIRSDSAAVLLELKNSSHDLVMITGDQALTACHVASQVHIVSNPVLILGQSRPGEKYKWVSPDEKEIIPYSDKEIETLAETHDLCIGGDSIEMLQATSAILLVIPFVKVFARVAPQQKELILTTFKDVGRGTLMCGDGTNDVGALKQAHVGVALLNAVPPSSTGSESSKDDSKSKKPKPPSEPTASKTVIQNGEGSSKGKMTPENRHLTAAELQRQKLKKMMDELNSDEGDGRSAPLVKLGDASMASPFTAKHASVAPVTDIIRQGRSTLVTTLQMFKILGLNCLATAYVLSVMYLDGVKLGDVQATISGVLTAAFFLFISHARPLQTLSAERPHPSVFSLYLFLSLLGQFAVHIAFLIYSVKEAEKHMPEECIEPDATFHPNLVNTVSYMVSMMLQVATFAVNYMGHPFNQSIRENKPFFYALIAGAGFFTVIASDLFRDLNDSLKLVPLPEGMRDKLLLWALLMFVICYSWEGFLRWAFPGATFSELVGSAYYVAPEVLHKHYSRECDVWSAGVILYILLCGFPPFWDESEFGIFRKILQGKIDFETSPWPSISESAKDLIVKMLEKDPKKRLTAHQVLCHPWIVDDKVAPDKPLDCAVLSRLKNFSAMNKLKKMAFRVIAERLSEEEIGGLKELFRMIDTDNSGTITFEELKDTVKRVGADLMESEIQELLRSADVDENGSIDYGEFLAATIHLNKLEREENLVAAFSFFDKDGSGYITVDELQQALKEFGINDSHLGEMIKDIDQDNDGQIDYGEFVAMMRKGNGSGGISRRTMRNTLNFANWKSSS
ncbi:hypothetical protein F2Q68_00018910 [Brassica cretica]|uniref:non-specific serine/threonine protein kinase n=1 Tax=Brassica cretica TaxID=69181 RepID=A0A8S9FTS7_BRACR|nr:hypothetical protein F2Q68_00018910 [Brassica cretica]